MALPQRHLPLIAPALELAPAPPRPSPRSVRLSLTDRCDLACVYCRPNRRDGYLEDRLSDTAWKAMIEGLVRAGVRRVRLTGGEPLLHPRVVELVSFLDSLALEDLALTTNGTQLAHLAKPLQKAGLRRLTISLDSLIPERFFQLTRGGHLGHVLEGIDAALEAGFEELKINTVVLRDRNDDELESLTRWSWERRITPRFIEVMRVGEGAKLPVSILVTAKEMQQKLTSLLAEGHAQTDPDRGPARYLHSRENPTYRVGFISGTSETFCEECDRLRVASDGVLRPCLATNDGVDASQIARTGTAEEIEQAVAQAWAMKPDGRTWKGCTEPSAAEVSMRAIGG